AMMDPADYMALDVWIGFHFVLLRTPVSDGLEASGFVLDKARDHHEGEYHVTHVLDAGEFGVPGESRHETLEASAIGVF
ncbi:MAG: hypothetical protein M1830_005820, partial [Pleopsidium flavum]